MERMTHERCNGIKTGYWSAATKEELVQRLALYENTGLEPWEIGPAIEMEGGRKGHRRQVRRDPQRHDPRRRSGRTRPS